MTRGFYNYPTQSVIPCECGSTEPYWHGDSRVPPGRVYCCDGCWQKANGSAAEWERQKSTRDARRRP